MNRDHLHLVPRDYAESRFVHPMDREQTARILGEPDEVIDTYAWLDAKPRRLTFGERLVLFFRLNGETIGFVFAMCAIAFAVGAFVFAYMGAL